MLNTKNVSTFSVFLMRFYDISIKAYRAKILLKPNQHSRVPFSKNVVLCIDVNGRHWIFFSIFIKQFCLTEVPSEIALV